MKYLLLFIMCLSFISCEEDNKNKSSKNNNEGTQEIIEEQSPDELLSDSYIFSKLSGECLNSSEALGYNGAEFSDCGNYSSGKFRI